MQEDGEYAYPEAVSKVIVDAEVRRYTRDNPALAARLHSAYESEQVKQHAAVLAIINAARSEGD